MKMYGGKTFMVNNDLYKCIAREY